MRATPVPPDALELRQSVERLGRALDVRQSAENGDEDAASPETTSVRWSEVESDDRLDTEEGTTYSVSKLLETEAVAAVLELTRLFAEALTTEGSADDRSYLEGLIELLPLDSDLTAERIRSFVRDNKEESGDQFSGLRLDLVLRIDKRRLLVGLPEDVQGNLFLFTERLESFLGKPFPNLERWWRDDSADRFLDRALVLVGTRDLHLQGPRLVIFAGEPRTLVEWLQRPLEKSPPEGEEESKAAEPTPTAILEAAGRLLHWERDWLHHLTPLHLDLEAKAAGEGPVTADILNSLRVHRINLCILFTADRTRTVSRDSPTPELADEPTKPGNSGTGGKGPDDWMATYAGGQRQVDLCLQTPSHTLPQESELAAQALTHLVRWTYIRKFQTDRLSFVQSSIAQALYTGAEENTEDRRYDLLVQWSPTGWSDIQTRWKLFIESKIEEFTAQVQALEDHVANTMRAFASESATMIKNLTDAMLAAVAAVLGSFLAALLKQPFDPGILALGVLLYTLYLLVFPLGYGMSQRWSAYRSLTQQFENRRTRFELRLYPEKVNEIVGTQFEDAKNRFVRWFVATLVAYLGVTAALLITLTLAALWKLFG